MSIVTHIFSFSLPSLFRIVTHITQSNWVFSLPIIVGIVYTHNTIYPGHLAASTIQYSYTHNRSNWIIPMPIIFCIVTHITLSNLAVSCPINIHTTHLLQVARAQGLTQSFAAYDLQYTYTHYTA